MSSLPFELCLPSVGRVAAASFLATFLVLSPRLALADPTPPLPPGESPQPREREASAWRQRRLSIEQHAQVPRGPAGLMGIGLAFAVQERVSVVAGIGAEEQPQPFGGIQLRPVLFSPRSAFHVGAGLFGAADIFECTFGCDDRETSKPTAVLGVRNGSPYFLWSYLEAGYEYRFRFGLLLRGYGGAGIRLSKDRPTCFQQVDSDSSGNPLPGAVPYDACDRHSRWGPYMGLTVGYAFRL